MLIIAVGFCFASFTHIYAYSCIVLSFSHLLALERSINDNAGNTLHSTELSTFVPLLRHPLRSLVLPILH